MLTMKRLEKFVKTRNRSGFISNLQFQIDAAACALEATDLGEVSKFRLEWGTVGGEPQYISGYQWKPLVKVVSKRHSVDQRAWLVEFGGRLYLNDHDDPNTRSMFELMKRAQSVEVA